MFSAASDIFCHQSIQNIVTAEAATEQAAPPAKDLWALVNRFDGEMSLHWELINYP